MVELTIDVADVDSLTITVSDSESVDLNLSDRNVSENKEDREIPPVGTIARDTRPPHWSRDNRVEVLSYPGMSANEYVIDEQNSYSNTTIADKNPEFPEDDHVVICSFVEGSDSEYAYPISRLEY